MKDDKNFYNNWKFYLGVFIILVAIGVAVSIPFIIKKDENSSDNSVATIVGKFIYGKGSENIEDYEKDIKNSLDRWDKVLKYDEKIPIVFYTYSSNDSTLAFAYMNDENDIYGGGAVYINTYNRAETTMTEILIHEIGHVLGIGTSSKWKKNTNGGVLNKNNFPKAYGYYKDWVEKNNKTLNESGIPLDVNKNHWSEEVFDTEMMTPISESAGVKLSLSKITLGALEDLGWNIDYSKADNF